MRIKYRKRANQYGRAEYYIEGAWRTVSGHAKKYGTDHRGMLRRIEGGYPPDVQAGSYYISGGEHEGRWFRMMELTKKLGRSEPYFIRRRVEIDGIWTLDLSEEAEELRREEFKDKCSHFKHMSTKEDDRVIAKDIGDPNLAHFASLRFITDENAGRSRSEV